MSKYQRYMDASNKAVDLFVRNIAEDGEFKGEGHSGDLSALYKTPTLLLLGGRLDVASRLLHYMKKRFGQKNGDFLSYPDKSGKERRTANVLLQDYAPYMGGWILTAAQRMGRFDVSRPAYDYIQSYWSPKARSFIFNEPYDGSSDDQIIDSVVCSHLGLISLFFNDMDKARGAADTVVRLADQQTELNTRFVLRMWASTGKLITEKVPPESPDIVWFVNRTGKDELFFTLGFPAIFLAKFYLATNEAKYLESAKKYLDFALTCDQSLYSFYLSHKVAYGAAIVAGITKDEKYVTLATNIADFLVSEQDKDGVFSASRMPVKDDQYDQAAEIGIWLREIYAELSEI